MNDRETCRRSTCDQPPRGSDHPEVRDAFAARFCSTACELSYKHNRADARQARRDARRAAREEDGL